MLSAIVENEITKEKEYLYLKQENNNLLYYGFSIQNCNIKPIDKNIINKIYDLLRVNDNCIYVEDYLDYQVYLDKENNIKHYLKNGVEDFIMLFKNNGEDLNLYINSNNKNNSNNKKFKIGKLKIKLSKNFIVYLSAIIVGISMGLPLKNVTSNIKSNEESTNSSVYIENEEINKPELEEPNIIYSTPNDENLNLEPVDYEDAIDLINSSSLSQSLKEIASNEALLKDVFRYYKNTDMEYVIKNRLNNLSIEVYSKDYYKTGNIEEYVAGYYDELTPNELHIREDVNIDSTFKHEYIHLLQSCNCEYSYLIEATAEIVSYEYLDSNVTGYLCPVENTRLLMDVIGPKMIWETVFGGDETNLENTLRSNLNESEAEELILFLKQSPAQVDENNKHERITKLISNLYKNINLSDIKNDTNIYYLNGNHVDKIYFNEDKIAEKTLSIYTFDEAYELGLVGTVFDEKYLKEISEETYINYKEKILNSPEYQKLQKDYDETRKKTNKEFKKILLNYENEMEEIMNISEKYCPLRSDVTIFHDDVYYKEMTDNGDIIYKRITIPEAVEKGLISKKYYEKVNGKNLTEEEKQKCELYMRTFSHYVTYGDNISFIEYDEYNQPIKIQVKEISIKEMFPDQTVRNNNNMVR